MMDGLVVAQFLAMSSALIATVFRRVPVPFFIAFLCFDLALGIVSVWSRSQSQLALRVWIWGQLMTGLFWLAIFLEVRKLVLNDYPGIGSIADKITGLCIAIGAILVWLTANDNFSIMMRLAIFVPRVVAGSLFLGMLLLGALMRHYRTELHPNTAVHARLFFFYLGAQAIGLWSGNLASKELLPMVTVARMLLSFLCFVGWSVLLIRHRYLVYMPSMTRADLERAQARSKAAVEEFKGYVE